MFTALIAKVFWEGSLIYLNMGEVRHREYAPPEALREVMDETAYRKFLAYTLAKSEGSSLLLARKYAYFSESTLLRSAVSLGMRNNQQALSVGHPDHDETILVIGMIGILTS